MPTESIPGIQSFPEESINNLRRAQLDRIGALAISLENSRKSLLALDLAGMERETARQFELLEELNRLRFQLRSSTSRPENNQPETSSQMNGYAVQNLASSELEEELKHAAMQVLDACRLHSALLARSQTKLRVLKNMLAGPSVNYDAITAGNGRLRPVPHGLEQRI
jgi:hypothetical protein